MDHVYFWLPLWLVLFLLGQINAVSDQCGELQSEIARISKLNHRNELLLDQCYEQLKIEAHVSEAAFRSLKLEEDESKFKLRQIQQLEANKNIFEKGLDELKIKFEQLEKENKDLEKRLQQLEADNNYLKQQLEEEEAVLKRKDAELKQLQTVIDDLRTKVALLNQTQQISSEDEMVFYIQSVHSGKYLDVEGNVEDEGTPVIFYDFHGNENQQWSYRKGMIVSKLNGLVLDISGRNENGEIIMWPDNGGDNQKWYFDEDMTIRSELGSVLDVKNGSTNGLSLLIATSKNGTDHQKFRRLPVEK